MRIASVIILLFAVTLPCFAELTEQDIERIGNLIDRKLEPVKLEITAIKLDIAEMKAKMATKDDITAVKLDIVEMKGKMATKDDIIATRQNLTQRMDTLYGVLIGVLIAIIVVILSIIFTPFLRRWIERREQVRVGTGLEELNRAREAEEKRREIARRIVEERPEFEEAYKAVGLL